MGKVTVKHYLNTRLKPSLIKEGLAYPVYVRVTYGRKNSRFSSEWIIHPQTEIAFNEDPRVLELIKYETKLINEILSNEENNESLSIVSRLRFTTDSISNCFRGWTLGVDNAKEQIMSFIVNKTELDRDILNPFFNLDYIDSKGWAELAEKGVFDYNLKIKALFLSLLYEFENENYKEHHHDFLFKVGEILNFYEWRENGGRLKFIEFARKKNILTIDELDKILQQFDKDILEWSSFDMRG